ncbi:4-phosphoerythronate dehydrogenase [Candidatus Providencia siddallii]|uniref:Erythronate-4-phosphate dehydrogenase n=1 Tax=Candidatus Providencia siddallii TaxID=1715285 RepID=A0ABP1CDI6_9GAMM
MKVLIDENISCIEQLFGNFDEVKKFYGRIISSKDLINVDALIIRSITKVNKILLKNTSIKFIGTTTSGIDHIDIQLLKSMNIYFSFAPGCNSIAVVEYVFSSILVLAERQHFNLCDKIVGIVGVGNIGKILLKRLTSLGIKCILCDPPRAVNENSKKFVSLSNIVKQADIITLHAPLNLSDKYNTYHLMNLEHLSNLRDGAILINTSRGELIDNKALLSLLIKGKKISVVLDVWEYEPKINVDLLNLISIGTSHIAGYTFEGKTRGTIKIYEDYNNFFDRSFRRVSLLSLAPKCVINEITVNGKLTQEILKRLIHLVYDVRSDDSNLRLVSDINNEFDQLRKNYKERREWSSLKVKCNFQKTAILLNKLGFNACFK